MHVPKVQLLQGCVQDEKAMLLKDRRESILKAWEALEAEKA